MIQISLAGSYSEKTKTARKEKECLRWRRRILFFDEVHNLAPDFQERLFIYMDNGRFQRIGEKDRWRASSARLIFATTKKPEEALLKTLLRRIPFVTQMPDLEERSLNEKEELSFFLKKEAKRIGREVYFSRQVLNILLNYVYKENVGRIGKCYPYVLCGSISEQHRRRKASDHVLSPAGYSFV